MPPRVCATGPYCIRRVYLTFFVRPPSPSTSCFLPVASDKARHRGGSRNTVGALWKGPSAYECLLVWYVIFVDLQKCLYVHFLWRWAVGKYARKDPCASEFFS